MSDQGEDDYDSIPLHHQRGFGAGIKRKRIDFVPQSSQLESVPAPNSTTKRNAGDAYLSIVLGKKARIEQEQPEVAVDEERTESTSTQARDAAICPTCNTPMTPTHHLSLSHQLSLPHSHPPSHLDRTSKGLTYLTTYGYDPDSRVGLGASGTGRLHPVRAVDRSDKDKLGIGATKENKIKAEKAKLLDAGKVRKKEEDATAKAERLRALVYGNDEVNQYLGVTL